MVVRVHITVYYSLSSSQKNPEADAAVEGLDRSVILHCKRPNRKPATPNQNKKKTETGILDNKMAHTPRPRHHTPQLSSVFLVVEPSKIIFLIYSTIPPKEDISLLYHGYHSIPK